MGYSGLNYCVFRMYCSKELDVSSKKPRTHNAGMVGLVGVRQLSLSYMYTHKKSCAHSKGPRIYSSGMMGLVGFGQMGLSYT